MDGKTLAPKSIVLDGDFSRMIFDTTLKVENGTISGEYVRKQPADLAKSTRPFSAELPDDVIFRPAIFGVIPGLPLDVGAHWELQWFSPLAASLQDVKLEVTGIETVDTAAGTFETYAVYITAPQSNIAYVHHRRTAARSSYRRDWSGNVFRPSTKRHRVTSPYQNWAIPRQSIK